MKWAAVVVAVIWACLAQIALAQTLPEQTPEDLAITQSLAGNTLQTTKAEKQPVAPYYLRKSGLGVLATPRTSGSSDQDRPPLLLEVEWSIRAGKICQRVKSTGQPSDFTCSNMKVEGDAVTIETPKGPTTNRIVPGNPGRYLDGEEAVTALVDKTLELYGIVSTSAGDSTEPALTLYLAAGGTARAGKRYSTLPQREILSGTWSVRNGKLCLTGLGYTGLPDEDCLPVLTMQNEVVTIGGLRGMTGKILPGNARGLAASTGSLTGQALAGRLVGNTVEAKVYGRPDVFATRFLKDGTALLAVFGSDKQFRGLVVSAWSVRNGALCWSDGKDAADCTVVTADADTVTMAPSSGEAFAGPILPGNPYDLTTGQDAIKQLAGNTIELADKTTSSPFQALYLSPDGGAYANVANAGVSQRNVRAGRWEAGEAGLRLVGFEGKAPLDGGWVSVVTMKGGGGALIQGDDTASIKVLPGDVRWLAPVPAASAGAQTDQTLLDRLKGKTIELTDPRGRSTQFFYAREDGKSLEAMSDSVMPGVWLMDMGLWSIRNGAFCRTPIGRDTPRETDCHRIVVTGDTMTVAYPTNVDGPWMGKISSGNGVALKEGQEAITALVGNTAELVDPFSDIERPYPHSLTLYLAPDGTARGDVAFPKAPKRDIRSGSWALRDGKLCVAGLGKDALPGDGCVSVMTMKGGDVNFGYKTVTMIGQILPGNARGLKP